MTTIQEQRDRLEMDDLASALRRSVELTPEDFDGREPLWMRREDLRAGLIA